MLSHRNLLGARSLRPLGVAALLVATASLAACGSSGGSTSNATTTNGTAGTASALTIATSSASTITTELYLANDLGYAHQYGVTLDITNAGALGPTEVAAGKVDLAQFGASAPLAPAAQGRPMSIVYAIANSVTRGITVPSNSPITSGTTQHVLMQLSGKKLVTQGTVGSGYGNATMVSNWIVAHGGTRPTIVSVQDASGISSQLLSGQADAAVMLPDYVAGGLAAGKLKMIVPNTDPVMTQITGGNYPAVTLFGLTSDLHAKAKAVRALVAALRAAHHYVLAHSTSNIAATLAKDPAFSGQSVGSIDVTLKYDPPFFSPDNGYIASAAWTKTLNAMKNWGTGLDLTQPTFNYARMVDMSYWNGATALLRSAQ
jgi:ABC-type nitrate/sulfonate/bicarbonate transport system substrate-binding protein